MRSKFLNTDDTDLTDKGLRRAEENTYIGYAELKVRKIRVIRVRKKKERIKCAEKDS